MNIAIIGASGFVGKALVNEATSRGHHVTAIARNPESAAGGNVTTVKADVTNKQQLSDAIKGTDLVISAFNAGWENPNLYNDFLEGSKDIQQAVKESGVKRLIVVGGASSLYDDKGVQLYHHINLPTNIMEGVKAAKDYLEIIKEEQELDWTFFSPAIEMHQGTSGKRKGHYRTSLETPVYDESGRSILSVEDLAVALIDEAEQAKFVKKRFTAAY